MGTNAQQNSLAGAQAQLAGGTLEQQQAQNLLNTQYQQFQQQQAYPFNTTQWLANIVEGIGGQRSQGSTTTQSSPNNDFSNVVGTGLGLAGLFFKKGGAVNGGIEGYASGGGMELPDIEVSYVPQTSPNAMIPQMKAVSPPQQQPQQDVLSIANAINPNMMKSDISGLKNVGKGIEGFGKGLIGGSGGIESLGAGMNAAGKGSSAYDMLAASDAGAGGLGSLASLFGFKNGGGIEGYADGGYSPIPDQQDPMQEFFAAKQNFSMQHPDLISQVNQNPLDIAAADPNNSYVSGIVPSGVVDNRQPSNIPPALQQAMQGQPAISEPPALSTLQTQLARNAPELDKGLALSKAGFAMAANKDQNFFHNVGAGAVAGLEDYAKQKQVVSDYALKQAEAEQKAQQLAVEAERYNKMLQIEQQNADTNKQYKDIAGHAAQMKAETYQKMNDPAQLGNSDPEMAGLAGDDFINALSQKKGASYANKIKAMADTGNIPNGSAKSPIVQQELSDIYQYAPSSTSATKVAIQKWNSGPQGDQLRFLSNTYAHLGTLQQLGQALQNGDVQAINTARNKFKSEFGYSAPTNFEAAKQIVSNELVKSVVNGRGALGDREEAQAALSQANSPEQLNGVVSTYQSMLNGQAKGMYNQFKVGTKQSDEEFLKHLDAPARENFVKMMGNAAPSTTSNTRPSDEDLAFTAKKHGMTVEQVKEKLGIQ